MKRKKDSTTPRKELEDSLFLLSGHAVQQYCPGEGRPQMEAQGPGRSGGNAGAGASGKGERGLLPPWCCKLAKSNQMGTFGSTVLGVELCPPKRHMFKS